MNKETSNLWRGRLLSRSGRRIARWSLWTLRAILSGWSFRTSRTLLTVLTIWASRTSRALWPGWSCRSHGALRSDWPHHTDGTCWALLTLNPGFSSRSLRPLCAHGPDWPLLTLCSCCTTCGASRALFTLWSLFTLRALRPLDTLRAGGTSIALSTRLTTKTHAHQHHKTHTQ